MANWRRRLDLVDLWKGTEEMTFAERDENIRNKLGKEVAKRIRELLKDEPGEPGFVQDVVEEADCADAFDGALEQLYEWADYNHNCWVATF